MDELEKAGDLLESTYVPLDHLIKTSTDPEIVKLAGLMATVAHALVKINTHLMKQRT